MKPINIHEKFNLFTETWTPKIIGELNGQYVKLARVKDEFVWHSHEHEDELFMVFKGTLYIDFRDRTEVIKEGEMIIVPKGVEHNPRTNGEEVWVLLFEPKETAHTGNIMHERTVQVLDWI
jgi:mannose-6-phosphate isomerase-like protein (cupin superfamily)